MTFQKKSENLKVSLLLISSDLKSINFLSFLLLFSLQYVEDISLNLHSEINEIFKWTFYFLEMFEFIELNKNKSYIIKLKKINPLDIYDFVESKAFHSILKTSTFLISKSFQIRKLYLEKLLILLSSVLPSFENTNYKLLFEAISLLDIFNKSEYKIDQTTIFFLIKKMKIKDLFLANLIKLSYVKKGLHTKTKDNEIKTMKNQKTPKSFEKTNKQYNTLSESQLNKVQEDICIELFYYFTKFANLIKFENITSSSSKIISNQIIQNYFSKSENIKDLKNQISIKIIDFVFKIGNEVLLVMTNKFDIYSDRIKKTMISFINSLWNSQIKISNSQSNTFNLNYNLFFRKNSIIFNNLCILSISNKNRNSNTIVNVTISKETTNLNEIKKLEKDKQHIEKKNYVLEEKNIKEKIIVETKKELQNNVNLEGQINSPSGLLKKEQKLIFFENIKKNNPDSNLKKRNDKEFEKKKIMDKFNLNDILDMPEIDFS